MVRISAPSDLLEGDQVKQIGYVMDILHHGHWVVQYEITGEVATKPPLYNWLAAGICLLFETTAEWAMKLPALLSAMVFVVSLFRLARRLFDERVAFYAVLCCIASHHFAKLMWFARTDMLLAACVMGFASAVVNWRWTWWKSLGLGLLAGLSFLAKGPLGPALCGLFLLAWGHHHGALRSLVGWKRLLPGVAVCLAVSGAWLWAAWGLPNFKHTVIDWQLGARMVDPDKARPFYYYIGHLFTRIAPWPCVALCGVWLARRRTDWPQVTLLLVWFGLSFLLLSLVPVKRHDHLLPVYPAMFVLAGLGLRYLVEPVVTPEAFWVLYPLSAGLAATPMLVVWSPTPMTSGLIAVAFTCGAIATWCYLRRARVSLAVVLAGVVCVHGLYHHWWYGTGRSDYAQLRTFVEAVRQTAPDSHAVVVFQAHPLIAYELGQHEILPTIPDLSDRRPDWVIMPDYFAPVVSEQTGWHLTQQAEMTLLPREDRATLYRVEPPAQLSSRPDRAVH